MKDESVYLITEKDKIKENTSEYYNSVLKNRKMDEKLDSLEKERKELAKMRMKLAAKNKTPEWKIEDLDEVLKGLKKNKSRDALGYCNEIFMPNNIGTDLKMAILKLMNRIKQTQIFPEARTM
jgi:septal ring factor EnvC (AmiA/AmiB activator)